MTAGDSVEFSVTYTLTTTVHVSTDYVPEGYTLPENILAVPKTLRDAIEEALAAKLSETGFEELTAIYDEGGNAAL